jgi:hypothetical protein
MRLFLAFAAGLNLMVALSLLGIARSWSRHVYKEGQRDGESKGYREGFGAGRKSSEQYWLEIERQVGEERAKMWKEEE